MQSTEYSIHDWIDTMVPDVGHYIISHHKIDWNVDILFFFTVNDDKLISTLVAC